MVTENDVRDALKSIVDPDLHRDIVSLGFVKDLVIDGSQVSFAIELTTPACPVKARFQQAAEQAVGALPGVETVKVTMTARRPERGNRTQGLEDVGAILAVASCKGGVGKSTVAAQVACELARRGQRVGLLDADLFGPSVPTLFQVHQPALPPSPRDNMVLPYERGGLKIMSFGFFLGNRPAVMRGPMVAGYVQSLLQQVDWGPLDYLILDLPPGTGDVQLTLTQTLTLAGAIIVTTRQALSLVDVEKGIQMFEKVRVPLLGLVENMAGFVCDGCGKEHHLFGTEQPLALQTRYGLETLARLPVDPALSAALGGGPGHPLVAELVDQVIRSLGRQSLGNGALPTVSYDATHVQWADSDGTTQRIEHRLLRTACPCAECVDEYTGERRLDPATVPADVRPTGIEPLGRYAVQITWSDGHNHGLYAYSLLNALARREASGAT